MGVLYTLVVYQVISLGFDMDKAAAEVEALEKEKVEKEAREEEKRRCSHSPSDLFFLSHKPNRPSC